MLLSTQIYIITFFFASVLSLFVLLNNPKSLINRFFSLLVSSLALWILSNIFVNLAYSYDYSLSFVRVAIIWVALLPIFFNQFVKYLYFPRDKNYEQKNKIFLYASYVVTAIIVLLSQTTFNVKSISLESWGVDYEPGILYLVLLCYLLIAFGFSFFHLFKISQKTKDETGQQARLILIGACITLILSLFTNIVFPFLGYGFFNTFGPTTVLIFLSFIAYSITKHHLFNIRVIAIELVTFGLWMTILVRTFLAETRQEMAIEIGLLAITVIFGIMLIQSTMHEIKQREHIEKLAKDLQKAYKSVDDTNKNLEHKVAEQTQEISRAYEVEKTARRELEKLNQTKDELITASQHNLRTPLTALRWQLEVIRKNAESTDIVEGADDPAKAGDKTGLQEALKESEESVNTLTKVLEDFLEITEIKVSGKNTRE